MNSCFQYKLNCSRVRSLELEGKEREETCGLIEEVSPNIGKVTEAKIFQQSWPTTHFWYKYEMQEPLKGSAIDLIKNFQPKNLGSGLEKTLCPELVWEPWAPPSRV